MGLCRRLFAAVKVEYGHLKGDSNDDALNIKCSIFRLELDVESNIIPLKFRAVI
jgi:hypothetical protein